MKHDKELYKQMFIEHNEAGNIIASNASFKIKQFLKKAENSLAIAYFHKNINPTNEQPEKMYWIYWAITISYYSILYATKAIILTKGYEVKTHEAAQIALGHLCLPSQIEKEDLELLNEAQKIFEEEYITYFQDARTESNTARYSAIKKYSERRVDEIYENARKFILKIKTIIG
jgi:uncharacterized protein (UPF0332 family)